MGHHTVEMRYRTPGLRAGAMVSLAGCVLFIGLALAWLRWRRKGEAGRVASSSLAG
jgi:hypothetical protein